MGSSVRWSRAAGSMESALTALREYNLIALDHFNIVHIQPPNLRPALGHWDVAPLLFHSFQSLGRSVALKVNKMDRRAINVIVGYERISADPLPADLVYIPYQLEQIADGGKNLSPAMESCCAAPRRSGTIPENAASLRGVGVEQIRILPLGFHDKLASIVQREEDVDVLFYGLMNSRRHAILRSLAEKCSVRCLRFVYGEQRDHWIARSKLVLNIHYYPAKIAEQVRISYPLNNRRCVVTEESMPNPLSQFCVAASYERLVETCLALVAILKSGTAWQRPEGMDLLAGPWRNSSAAFLRIAHKCAQSPKRGTQRQLYAASTLTLSLSPLARTSWQISRPVRILIAQAPPTEVGRPL